MSAGLISSWSFNRLKDFEKCPLMAWYKHGEKRKSETPPDPKSEEARNRGIQVHNEAEAFVKGEGDFTKNLSKHAEYFEEVRAKYTNGRVLVEDEWGFTESWEACGFFADEVWLRMKLDNIIFDDDEKTSATVTDYKTGKKFGNEVTHNEQGQLYAVGSFMRHPSLETVTTDFVYLDQGVHSKPRTYTREQAMVFLPIWERRAKRLTEAQDFPPKANKQTCMWCPFGPQHGDATCEWGV